MILLIDNYDSFSYNLYQLVGTFGKEVTVIRNDEKTLSEIEAMQPERIILSPGPGRPADAGICLAAVTYFAGKIPILGVCLGHQAICEAYGVTVSYAKELMHGKQSQMQVDNTTLLFTGLPDNIEGARYHSLAVLEETLPPALQITARTPDGEIMAIQHSTYPTYGLQFHPESILTPAGPKILQNFIYKQISKI